MSTIDTVHITQEDAEKIYSMTKEKYISKLTGREEFKYDFDKVCSIYNISFSELFEIINIIEKV